jgi:hypothetical protein
MNDNYGFRIYGTSDLTLKHLFSNIPGVSTCSAIVVQKVCSLREVCD